MSIVLVGAGAALLFLQWIGFHPFPLVGSDAVLLASCWLIGFGAVVEALERLVRVISEEKIR